MVTFTANGASVGANSLTWPIANLANGYTFATHFQNNTAALYRFASAFLEKVLEAFATIDHLGIAIAKDIDSASTSAILLSHVWTVTYQRLHKANAIPSPIPVPSGGTNVGVGDFLLTDIFSGAAKVASGANVAADSVVIPVSELELYGCPAYADLDLAATDGRLIVAAIIRYLIDLLPVRATGTTSAITAKSNNAPIIPTTTQLGTNIATTNPTSGITSSDLFTKSFVSQQIYALTIEMAEDPSTRTVDVHVA